MVIKLKKYSCFRFGAGEKLYTTPFKFDLHVSEDLYKVVIYYDYKSRRNILEFKQLQDLINFLEKEEYIHVVEIIDLNIR